MPVSALTSLKNEKSLKISGKFLFSYLIMLTTDSKEKKLKLIKTDIIILEIE